MHWDINALKGLCVLFLLAIGSCQSSTSSSYSSAEVQLVSVKPMVTVAEVNATVLTLTVHSNGKMEAVRKVDLRFEHDGVIKQVAIGNGSLLQRGELVALQDDEYPLAEQQKIKEATQKAQLNVRDLLLGSGYSDSSSTEIPTEVMTMARVRSGLADVNQQQVLNRKWIVSTRLTAPFTGRLANVAVKEGDMVSAGQRICTLVDNGALWVIFSILENELGLVHPGDTVIVTPVAWPGKKFEGIVQQINPLVDAHGFIEVKALVKNSNGQLLDGMNVSIVLIKRLHRVIAIPKWAVVKRQEKQVVFVLKNGRSVWRYIQTGNESSDSVLITSGLHLGDTVMISGHESLAHDVEVEVRKEASP